MKNIIKVLLTATILLASHDQLNAQWTETSGPTGNVYALTAKGTDLFAGTATAGVFSTEDNGNNWNEKNIGLTSTDIKAFAINGNNFFAGTAAGVFVTTDNGASWTAANSGLTCLDVRALVVSGNKIYAATYGGGIYTSTNNGTNWISSSNGIANDYVRALAVMGTKIIAGTGIGVYISSDNGASWTQFVNGMTDKYIYALAVSGTNIFAGTETGGVYLSSDNGANWTAVNSGLTSLKAKSFAVSDNNIFVGTLALNVGGVFHSTNNGTTWTAINTGLTNVAITSLCINGENIYAGIHSGKVWKRAIADITSISNSNEPVELDLSQNYPNPFNPSTVISFNLSKSELTNLAVYNTKGELMETIVNSIQPAGNHTVSFNASNLNSGVYFYSLKTTGNSIVRKMVLCK